MRERERVHKILFGVIVTIGIILYAGFNVWVYRSAKSGKGPSPKDLWQAVSPSGTGFQEVTGVPPVKKQGATLPESGSTPRPTGPGTYACDPLGTCNFYENPQAIGCPKTFADPRCLDSCGEKGVRCPK